MAYKVIQWATGGVGSLQLQEIIQNPEFELVGVFVYGADKVGVDAGTLCGLPPTGIKATNDKEKVFAMNADIVCHAATKYGTINTNAEDIERLLASGKNVVTTTTYNHLPTYGGGVQQRFEAACKKGNSSFFAAGENPGFMMQRLAATLTGLCKRIDQLILEEYFLFDWHPSYNMVFEGCLMGSPPSAITTEAHAFKINDLQYRQEIGATADLLGVKLDRIEPSIDVATLDYDLDIVSGRVPKGTAVGQRLSWTGYWRDKPFLTIREFWLVSRDISKWNFQSLTNWKNNDLFRIIIEGLPSFTMDLDMSMKTDLPYLKDVGPAHLMIGMTGVRVLADVCKAPPGIVRAPIFGAIKPY